MEIDSLIKLPKCCSPLSSIQRSSNSPAHHGKLCISVSAVTTESCVAPSK